MFALSLGWVLDPGKTNYGDDVMAPLSFAGWYFGFGMGENSGRDWDAARYSSSLAAQGVTATQTSSDSADFGFKAFSGYQFNKYLGLEGGYAQFNNYTANGTATGPAQNPIPGNPSNSQRVSAYQTLDSQTWALAVVGTLPLTKSFSVFGKLGANSWKATTNTNVHDSNGDFIRTSSIERGVDPYYGVGISYALMAGLEVRGEYERYDLGGSNIDFLSAGMAVKF